LAKTPSNLTKTEDCKMIDHYGLHYTGAEATSLDIFHTALEQLQCYIDDPVVTIDAAILQSPGFLMAGVLKAYLHLLGTEPGDIETARSCWQAAGSLGGNRREQAHIASVGALVQGHWHQAGRILEDLSIEYPRDLLALQAGHLVDFYTGNSTMLRDRMARAVTSWSKAIPGYHALLGMHAFGLEETGHYTEAERAGREAVSLNPRDGWAQHAVAHVMEMQTRCQDGIAWMRLNPEAWSTNSFFQVHNWWHLSLYHLELEQFDEVLALYDGPVYGDASGVVLDMIDASALLWRLHLLGIDCGERWQPLAENWQPIACSGTYAFNDVHAAMAFAGAGHIGRIDEILDAQQVAMTRDDDNAYFTKQVGHAVTLGIKAFAEGDYHQTIECIRPVRNIAHRFGGSHAQRDVIRQTLIEATLRSQQPSLAKAFVSERLQWRPESPLVARLEQRLRPQASQKIAVNAS
jgi:hypothetical protein